jgi:hypothetical protein
MMKNLISTIIGWALAIVLQLPLLPVFIVGVLGILIMVPLTFVVCIPMVLCRVSIQTLDITMNVIHDVCFLPMKLFTFAGEGLAQAFTNFGKDE